MEQDSKISEGLNELRRILNLMEYDVTKTSVENLIDEQRVSDLKPTPQPVSSKTIAPGAKLGQYVKSGEAAKNVELYNKYSETKKKYCSGPQAVNEFKQGNLKNLSSYKVSAVDATYNVSQDVAKQKAYFQQCQAQLSKFPKWIKDTYDLGSVQFKKYTSNDGDNFFVNMGKGEFAEAFLDLREAMWTDEGIIIASLIFYVGGFLTGGIAAGAEEVLWFCFMIADYFQMINNSGSERMEGLMNLIMDGVMIATGLLAGPILKKTIGVLKKLKKFTVESVSNLIQTYYGTGVKEGIIYLIQKLKGFLTLINSIVSLKDKGNVASFISSNAGTIKTEVENVIQVLENGVKNAESKGVKTTTTKPTQQTNVMSTAGKTATKLTAKQLLKKSLLHVITQVGILKLTDYAISKLFGVSKESANKLRTDKGRDELVRSGESDKFIQTATPETYKKFEQNKNVDFKQMSSNAANEVRQRMKKNPKDVLLKQINRVLPCITSSQINDFYNIDNIYFIIVDYEEYEWIALDDKLKNTSDGELYKC